MRIQERLYKFRRFCWGCFVVHAGIAVRSRAEFSSLPRLTALPFPAWAHIWPSGQRVGHSPPDDPGFESRQRLLLSALQISWFLKV